MPDPLESIRRFFDAWNSGDSEIDALLAPGYTFTGDPMHLGVTQGPVSFKRMRDEIPGEVRLTICELVDLGDGRVLVLGMGDLVSDQGGFAQELGWIITVDDEGLFAASEGFPDQAAARRAARVPEA